MFSAVLAASPLYTGSAIFAIPPFWNIPGVRKLSPVLYQTPAAPVFDGDWLQGNASPFGK
jgi:hypothetical protein